MSAISPASGSINPYTYYSQPISGKMEVPVMASQSLYANFQFVQGVPSSEGGLSLERLKVIDSLLAQINAHRQAGTAPIRREEVRPIILEPKPDTSIKLARAKIAPERVKSAQVIARVKIIDPTLSLRLSIEPGSVFALPTRGVSRHPQGRLEETIFAFQPGDAAQERGGQKVGVVNRHPHRP